MPLSASLSLCFALSGLVVASGQAQAVGSQVPFPIAVATQDAFHALLSEEVRLAEGGGSLLASLGVEGIVEFRLDGQPVDPRELSAVRPGDVVALSPSVDGMIVDVLRASADSGAFPTGSIRIVAGRRPDRSSGEVRVAQTVYLVNDHLLSGDELLGLPSDERVLLERRSTGVIIGWPDRVGGPGGPPEITLVRLEVRGEVGPLLLGGSG